MSLSKLSFHFLDGAVIICSLQSQAFYVKNFLLFSQQSRSYLESGGCSMFRGFNVPKVLYSEGSIFRRFDVPKVIFYEGSSGKPTIVKYITDNDHNISI